MSPSDTPTPPAIPDYTLLRLIGRGSYGDVWLARGVTGVFRAIKIVWRARFDDARPYEREFRGLTEFAAISLVETRQLALLHVGRNDAAGFFYYVMELADDAATGREIDPARYVPHTLKEVRARRGRLPAPEVITLGTDLARGLAGLHTRGLVHRDIKPSNIILVGGVPKLADIGLVASTSAGHTFVGTEGFVPPEGPGSPAADVFALGKLLYELATGLDRHDYPRLPDDLAALPDRKELLELNEILIRACAPLAAKRHTNAAALLDELLLLQAGKSVRRLRSAERRLTRALRFAAALAIVAAVAGVGIWIERLRANEESRRRQFAEQALESERRKSEYPTYLADARRAIRRLDFGSARKSLSRAAEIQAAVGPEWHELVRVARGDPCEVIREAGPAITKIVFSPDSKFVAIHDVSMAVTILAVESREQKRRIEGVHRLGGFSNDGQWLMGTSADSAAPQRWSLVDNQTQVGAVLHRSLHPIAIQGNDRLLVFVDVPPRNSVPKKISVDYNHAPPPAFAIWDFSEQREISWIRADPPRLGFNDEFDVISASNPRGTLSATIKLPRNSGALAFRTLHLAHSSAQEIDPTVVFCFDFLPSALGHLEGTDDTWWSVDSYTGRQFVLSMDERPWRWRPTETFFPIGTIARSQTRISGKSITLVAHQCTITQLHGPISHRDADVHRYRGHGDNITALAIDNNGGFLTGGAFGELRWWKIIAP